MMFAAILVKTRKVYQVFTTKILDARESFMNDTNLSFCPRNIEERLEKLLKPKPRQVITIVLLVSVQLFIILIWKVVHSYDDPRPRFAVRYITNLIN